MGIWFDLYLTQRFYISSFFTVGFLSCNPTKKAVVYADDRSFYSLPKEVRKDPSDTEKRNFLITLFTKVKEIHDQAVARLEANGLVPSEYDPVLQEYNAIQKLMNETKDSPISGLVVFSDYTSQISSVRETAVFYYQHGLEELSKDTRVSASAAYDLFGRVQRYISATLHIVRYESAPIEVDLRLVDIEQNSTLDWSRLQLGNTQIIEAATFSGDSRAISDADWQLINRDPNVRLNEQSMQLMYNQLLEQIRTKIRNVL